MAEQKKRPDDDQGSPANPKGERVLLAILAVFVILAMAGMMVIDHYGAPRPEQAARVHDAAGR